MYITEGNTYTEYNGVLSVAQRSALTFVHIVSSRSRNDSLDLQSYVPTGMYIYNCQFVTALENGMDNNNGVTSSAFSTCDISSRENDSSTSLTNAIVLIVCTWNKNVVSESATRGVARH